MPLSLKSMQHSVLTTLLHRCHSSQSSPCEFLSHLAIMDLFCSLLQHLKDLRSDWWCPGLLPDQIRATGHGRLLTHGILEKVTFKQDLSCSQHLAFHLLTHPCYSLKESHWQCNIAKVLEWNNTGIMRFSPFWINMFWWCI